MPHVSSVRIGSQAGPPPLGSKARGIPRCPHPLTGWEGAAPPKRSSRQSSGAGDSGQRSNKLSDRAGRTRSKRVPAPQGTVSLPRRGRRQPRILQPPANLSTSPTAQPTSPGPFQLPGSTALLKAQPESSRFWGGWGGDSPASSCRSRALSRGSGRAPILAGCRRAARYKAHGERAHGPERGGRPSSYSPNPRRPELEPRAPRTSKPSSAPPPPPSHAPDAPSSPPARRPAP